MESAAQKTCSCAEIDQLKERGFAHRIDHRGRFKLDGLPESYQTSFHTREYVNRVWTRWFDILDYVEGGLHGHQDIVVLRARTT